MKKLLIFLLLCSSGAYATDASTSTKKSLEHQEQIEASKKALVLLEQARSLLEEEALESESQCIKAVGISEFCKCISWKSPGNFIQYVTIISQTKDELNYDRLSKDDKKVVDNVRNAREECINY